MSKFVTLVLDSKEVDYLNEALDMLANYHDMALADEIGERLVEAWNNGEPLTPARKTMVEADRERKKKRKGTNP